MLVLFSLVPVAEIIAHPCNELKVLNQVQDDTFIGGLVFHGYALAGFSRNDKMLLRESCRT